MSVVGGRYRLLEPLGSGATATVYRADDLVHGRVCALKVLRLDGPDRERLAARLRREAETLTRLAHPNVVQVFEVGEEGGSPWIAMELVPGGTLADLVEREGPLSPRRALQVVLQILAGLEAVHAAGVVHRDVKPENVLVLDDGTCKLADFGIALVDQQTRTTASGFAMGSLPYMSPEQRVDAHAAGPRSDLYASGATLYFLLTGATPVDLFLASPSSPRFAGLPEGLVELVRQCTHADPSRRFQTAVEMSEALRRCLPLASDDALDATTPVYVGSPDRVETAVVPERRVHDHHAQALENEGLRELLAEQAAARQRSSRNMRRWSLALGVTLLGVVVAVGGRMSLDHWIAEQQAQRVALKSPLAGTWRGIHGTHEAELVLEGPHSLLHGEVRLRRAGDERTLAVRGVLDGGVLLLEVGPDGGRYRALLEVPDRLDGEYAEGASREPFHLVRIETPGR
ncbi:MAG: serine/threonine protein kinase [Alphaproteobacteria bacterium]|nr:serine/threonine protein kinase [Alphaproteobacteria bacterium]